MYFLILFTASAFVKKYGILFPDNSLEVSGFGSVRGVARDIFLGGKSNSGLQGVSFLGKGPGARAPWWGQGSSPLS